MTNTRETGRSTAGNMRTQLGWLLVLLVAAGAILLAVVGDLGVWLVFATGVAATFVVIALLRPFGDGSSMSFVRHAESGWGYLRTELARSRRYDRRFTVVGIPVELWGPKAATDDEKANLGLEVAGDVQRLVRRPDRAWVDESRLYLLLTDCNRQQGLAFLARARVEMPQLFGDERTRLAVFPDDGITSGALLASLDGSGLAAIEPERTGRVAAR